MVFIWAFDCLVVGFVLAWSVYGRETGEWIQSQSPREESSKVPLHRTELSNPKQPQEDSGLVTEGMDDLRTLW